MTEGWKLVEATEEMVLAGAVKLNESTLTETFHSELPWCGLSRSVLTAGLAAAPEPPRVSGEEVARVLTALDKAGSHALHGIIEPALANEAAAMIRRLALIEPSAGGGLELVGGSAFPSEDGLGGCHD